MRLRQYRALPAADKAAIDLYGRVAKGDPRVDGQDSHVLSPDDRGDGQTEQPVPEPAKHSDPPRGRPANSPGIRAFEAGWYHPGGRLFADRAARTRPYFAGRADEGSVPQQYGHPYEDGDGRVRRIAEEVDANMRRQAKAVNFGIVYGISDYGLSQNLNIHAQGSGAVHRAIFQCVRRRAQVHG